MALQRKTSTGNLILLDSGNLANNCCCCEYEVDPESEEFLFFDGDGEFDILTTLDTCGWTVSTSEDWITITSPPAGIGDGTVTFEVDDNVGVDDRAGTIIVRDGQGNIVAVFTINQGHFLVEPTMRATNNRKLVFNYDRDYTWPNRFYNPDGTLINGAIGEAPPTVEASTMVNDAPVVSPVSMPFDDFYAADLVYYDAGAGDPAGTRAAFLVNHIRTALNDDPALAKFLSNYPTFEGTTTMTRYDTVTLPLAPLATTVDYRDRLEDHILAIRKLEWTTDDSEFEAFPETDARYVESNNTMGNYPAARDVAVVVYAGMVPGEKEAWTDGVFISNGGPNVAFGAIVLGRVGAFMTAEGGSNFGTVSLTNPITMVPAFTQTWVKAQDIAGLVYFPPSFYDDPPINTWFKIADADTYTMTVEDVDSDVFAMFAASTAVPPYTRGWRFLQGPNPDANYPKMVWNPDWVYPI